MSKEEDIKKFILAISQNRYSQVAEWIENINDEDDIKLYQVNLFKLFKDNKFNKATFWTIGETISSANWRIFKPVLLESDFKHQYKDVISYSSNTCLKSIFSHYCKEDENIKDILDIIRIYKPMFDSQFLGLISMVSTKFNKPGHYDLIFEATKINIDQAISFLIKDNTLCSLYVLVKYVLYPKRQFSQNENFSSIRNLSGNKIKVFSNEQIKQLAYEIKLNHPDKKEVDYIYHILIDSCSHDMENMAEELIKNEDYAGFRALFREIYGTNRKSEFEKIKKNDIVDITITEIEENFIRVDIGSLKSIIPKNEIFYSPVRFIDEYLNVGDKRRAKVKDKFIDEKNKFNIQLSIKDCEKDPWDEDEFFQEGDEIEGNIVDIYDYGVYISIEYGIEGLLYKNDMTKMQFEALKIWNPEDGPVHAVIKNIDKEKRRISLTTIPLLDNGNQIWENIYDYYIEGEIYPATVVSFGDEKQLWAELEDEVEVCINEGELRWPKTNTSVAFKMGDEIKVKITGIDVDKRKIFGSIKSISPNPWEIANTVLRKGDRYKVKVINRDKKKVIVETLDHLKLIGNIPLGELSWFKKAEDLGDSDVPKEGDIIEAKIMNISPERFQLNLSVRQLRNDPWMEIRIGSIVEGKAIYTENGKTMIQLSNSLIALTKEKDISLGVDMIPFKIINCNRAAEYIYVSHKRYISDKKTDEIVKSFFKSV